MNTVAVIPSSRAAHATAWPWLPALAAITPAARSAVVERRELVDGAADLERARALQVLGLQPDPAAGQLRERLRAVDRRDARAAGEPFPRRLDVSERGCRRQSQS